ncbi:MAG TPA: HEAT repeat domain-containing protein [Gemmatimonadales bacterium]|nr:HEAT repeat domain-containing protein [Gemmatimonadales bacterium]
MTEFAARFRALVARAREHPGDEAGLTGLAAAAAAGVAAGPATLEAGFELGAGADAGDLLKSRLLARQVDRIAVAGGATPGELLALARALASEAVPVPSTPAVRVEMVEVIRPGSGAPAAPARERPRGIQLLGDEGVLPRRARPRTGLGREMEALGRAVEAAARRRQWVEALHAAQALVRLEHRFPEVERRSFAIEVRRVLARPILDGFVGLALRAPEEQERAAGVLRWLGAAGADAMVDHVKDIDQTAPRRFLHEALATMPAAVPLLLPLLDGDSPVAARHAAELLGRHRAAAALPGLARLAAHPDPRARHAAIDALAGFDDRRAVEALHRALGHAEAATRGRAAAALGRRGAGAAMPILAALEREPDPAARRVLVAAAASTDAPQAGAALAALVLRRRSLLHRDAWTVEERLAAVSALAEAGTPAARQALDRIAREGEGEVAAAALRAAAAGERGAGSGER